MEVLQEAFNRHGMPEIVNTAQGSQFTVHEFVQAVKDRGRKFSMDGREVPGLAGQHLRGAFVAICEV